MEDMDQVYRNYSSLVYRFLLARCRDGDLAEELTQETFYQAVKSAERYDGRCKLSVWLCQIAKHLWYQHLRRQKHAPEPLKDELPGGPVCPSAEDTVLARDAQMALLRRIHALPEPGREVLYLRLFGGLSFREIGEVLGRTENWSRVTFYRGRERLKRKGDQEDAGEES